jgi:hypothetical protein
MMSKDDFPGQAIIDAAWTEWVRDGTVTIAAEPQAQEHPTSLRTAERTAKISSTQMANRECH